jgi:ABC-2 type transport system ATP-binding protein
MVCLLNLADLVRLLVTFLSCNSTPILQRTGPALPDTSGSGTVLQLMLSLRSVHKHFGQIHAVNDLSLTVSAGEVFGLLGPNGAGKTTTVSMTVGLIQPDEGEITINDAGSPSDPRVRQTIGVAPQTLALYDELTGRENLRFFGRIQGLSGKQLKQRVDELLDMTGLSDRAGSRAGTYSGGMKRRLNLAVALVHDPDLILLDEPTAGVDPQSRNNLFEAVNKLRDRGKTIIYTTHYMEEAQRLCDRVGIIDRGRLLAMDTVDALIDAHGGMSTVRIERAAGVQTVETDNPAAELTRILADQADDAILNLRVDRPSLESVFLHLTGRTLRD